MRTLYESPDPEANPDYLGAGQPAPDEDPRKIPDDEKSE
jgi:hypothetical protein